MQRSIVAGLVMFVSGIAFASEPITLRLGSLAPEGSPYLEGCNMAAELVARNSKGAIKLKVFPGGMLGDERALIQQLVDGKIDIFAGSAAATHHVVPELLALELPFLFREAAEADLVMEQLWPLLTRAVEARGLSLLARTEVGFRHLGSRRAITGVEDLRAIKLRSQPNPVHAELWRLLGIRHVPLELHDVIGALEGGTVDSFDSATLWMFASAWHTQIKHFTLTRHIYQPGIMLGGPGYARRVPETKRRNLLAGAPELSRANIKKIRELEQALLAQLPELGVSVHSFPPELREQLADQAAAVRAAWRKKATPLGVELLDAIEKALAKHRQHAKL